MKHRIDPKIDCVFKALLGSEKNRNLLVHFLNAILTSDLTAPITEAEILNPYNDKEFLDDKLSVVDVKAMDSEGRFFQIEILLLTHRYLPERMVYTIFFTPRGAWCKENNTDVVLPIEEPPVLALRRERKKLFAHVGQSLILFGTQSLGNVVHGHGLALSVPHRLQNPLQPCGLVVGEFLRWRGHCCDQPRHHVGLLLPKRSVQTGSGRSACRR